MPDQYRGLAPDPSQATGESFRADEVVDGFQDETLQALIKEALANNYDMRIAAARILQASANLGITRANQFPTVNGGRFSRQSPARRRFPATPTVRHRVHAGSTTSSTSGDSIAALPKRRAPSCSATTTARSSVRPH